jgi:hypothetical protein
LKLFKLFLVLLCKFHLVLADVCEVRPVEGVRR